MYSEKIAIEHDKIIKELTNYVINLNIEEQKNFNINNLVFKINENKFNLNFASYLAGFIEGNGNIVIPIQNKPLKNKVKYPFIEVKFELRDLPLALIIQKELKLCSISKKKGASAYILNINTYEGLLLVSSLINGYMRTPKILDLWKLIDWLNKNNKNLNLSKKPLDVSNIGSNAWFSGIIDAIGIFSLNLFTSRSGLSSSVIKQHCRFELADLTQYKNNKNYLQLKTNIINFLSIIKPIKIKVKFKNGQLCKSDSKYKIRTTSYSSNIDLIKYLINYPLFSCKYLDFKDWIKAFALIHQWLNPETQTLSNREIYFKELKSKMKKNRTVFNWDHLNKFYKLEK